MTQQSCLASSLRKTVEPDDSHKNSSHIKFLNLKSKLNHWRNCKSLLYVLSHFLIRAATISRLVDN